MLLHPLLECIKGEWQQNGLVVILMSLCILDGQHIGIVTIVQLTGVVDILVDCPVCKISSS